MEVPRTGYGEMLKGFFLTSSNGIFGENRIEANRVKPWPLPWPLRGSRQDVAEVLGPWPGPRPVAAQRLLCQAAVRGSWGPGDAGPALLRPPAFRATLSCQESWLRAAPAAHPESFALSLKKSFLFF